MMMTATQAAKPQRSHTSFLVVLLALIAVGGVLCWHFGVFRGKPNIAMVAGESPYFNPIVDGAKEGARQYDVNLTIIRVKGDNQPDAIKTLLAGQHYDGVAISPVNPASEAGLLTDVAAATTLVTFDSDSPVSNRLCFVGTDNYSAGRRCGQFIREAAPDGGEIILSANNMDKENVQRRRQGVIDEVLDRSFEPERPMDAVDQPMSGHNYTIVTTLVLPTNADTDIPEMVKAIKAHPGVKCIAGLNTYSTPRLLKALDLAGMLGKIKIVGFDVDSETLSGIENGNVFATIMQDQFGCGFNVVRLLAENARGDRSGLPMFQRKTMPVEVVQAMNVAAVRAELDGKPMPIQAIPASGPAAMPTTGPAAAAAK